jgi:hypothetical protein
MIPNLSSDSGAPIGLSEVRWTRTTVGGPNYLGVSVTHAALKTWASPAGGPSVRRPSLAKQRYKAD